MKRIFFCSLGIFLFLNTLEINIKAQENYDLLLIKNQDFKNTNYIQKKTVTFGISESKNKFIRYNPLTLTFSLLMFGYQKWLSPQISAECLYRPTCSEYSKQLFKRYGFFIGLIATADRLMRCDRISATTINPISINEKDGKIHETPERYKLKE